MTWAESADNTAKQVSIFEPDIRGWKELGHRALSASIRVTQHYHIADALPEAGKLAEDRKHQQRRYSLSSEGKPTTADIHAGNHTRGEAHSLGCCASRDRSSFSQRILGTGTNKFRKQVQRRLMPRSGEKHRRMLDRVRSKPSSASMQPPQQAQVLRTRLVNRRNQCYLNALLTCLHELSAVGRRVGMFEEALSTLPQREELDILQSARWAPYLRDCRRPTQQHDVTELLHHLSPCLQGPAMQGEWAEHRPAREQPSRLVDYSPTQPHINLCIGRNRELQEMINLEQRSQISAHYCSRL